MPCDVKSGKSASIYVPRTFLGSGRNGFFVRDLPADLEAFQKEIDGHQADPALQGLGGIGRLLRNGRDAVPEARRQQMLDSQAANTPDARVVAGIAGPSRLILLVQEGDDQAGTGAGVLQLGEILQELGGSPASTNWESVRNLASPTCASEPSRWASIWCTAPIMRKAMGAGEG